MDAFRIIGGRPLKGTVRINSAKNAALPLMAATIMAPESKLLGVPDLSDTRSMIKLMASLGVTAEITPSAVKGAPGMDMACKVTSTEQSQASYDIMKTMRAGICVLGPMVGARGEARVSMPGGCAIGDRPIDLHLRGLKALGAKIELDGGYIVVKAPGKDGRLIGARVFLGGPNGSTVTGTANVMSAAVLAKGTTVIECAACEPEVVDLANFLNKMGAQISGAGTPRMTIQGVDSLKPATHQVMADRIEAGTYVCAAAMTGGDVVLENFPTDTLSAAIDRWNEMGVTLEPVDLKRGQSFEPGLSDTVRVVCERVIRATEIVTQPHPGFPTDLQAQFMALMTLADGNSIVTEKIYPDRFMHAPELSRMGAKITRVNNVAVVSGVRGLTGAPVMASDLRASASLVIAGLAARGETLINRVYHLDRGYQQMEVTLRALGADIERINVKEVC